MSKRPTDRDEPAAKKRASGRQLTKDDKSEDEEEEERGTIPLATDDILKGRRVVKARRGGTGAPPPTPTAGVPASSASANPFAGVSLLGRLSGPSEGPGSAPLSSSQVSTEMKPASQAEESKPQTAGQELAKASSTDAVIATGVLPPEQAADTATEPNDASVSGTTDAPAPKASQPAPAFANFAGSAAPFAATAGSGQSFGSAAKAAPSEGEAGEAGKAAGTNGATPGLFPFSFKPSGGGFPAVQGIFGSGRAGAEVNGASEPAGSEPDTTRPALATLPPESENLTGEEDEMTLWAGDGTLYEFDEAGKWRERGRGELKINRGPGRAARFVMRHRGLLKLIVNANLWPGMTVTPMDGGKGATFPVVNAAGAESKSKSLQTFAFRLKQASSLSGFIAAVNEYKVPPEGVKTLHPTVE